MLPQDRRTSRRKIPEYLSYIGLPSNNGGIVLDVSVGGVGFHSIAPIEADGPIAFRFSVDSATRVKAVGEIAWLDETRRTGGLRFTKLPDELREYIRTWADEPLADVQDIQLPDPVLEAGATSEAYIRPAVDDSIGEPQLAEAIDLGNEFDLPPFVLVPADEPVAETVAASGLQPNLAVPENFPFLTPEIEAEASLAKRADFSPDAARSNPVLYNLDPPVYSAPSYGLSMFPLKEYSLGETYFTPVSRSRTIKHPIIAIALTTVLAFFTAVGLFSYLSTTLLGQLVLAWGGEAIIGLQLWSNPQASSLPANSAPDSTKSARN